MLVISPAKLPLGSSHAPSVGGVVGELLRRYSVAWHMWEPANCVAHNACILWRPPALPLVVLVVNPAKRTLATPLQQARGRDVEQSDPREMPALALTQVPPYEEPSVLLQSLQAYSCG